MRLRLAPSFEQCFPELSQANVRQSLELALGRSLSEVDRDQLEAMRSAAVDAYEREVASDWRDEITDTWARAEAFESRAYLRVLLINPGAYLAALEDHSSARVT